MKIPRYITDLTRKDLEEIARAANPTPGVGMEIERKAGTIEFKLSIPQLKRMLWAFYHNGGFAASIDAIDDISLDPEG